LHLMGARPCRLYLCISTYPHHWLVPAAAGIAHGLSHGMGNPDVCSQPAKERSTVSSAKVA